MNRTRLALALTGTALAHPGGTVVRVPGSTHRQVSARTLQPQLAGRDFTLINVHIPDEGEITGTNGFVPFNWVAGHPALPRDRGAELVLDCPSGRMSEVAARTLVRLGSINIRELRGGMNAWMGAGSSLTNRPAGVREPAASPIPAPSARSPWRST